MEKRDPKRQHSFWQRAFSARRDLHFWAWRPSEDLLGTHQMAKSGTREHSLLRQASLEPQEAGSSPRALRFPDPPLPSFQTCASYLHWRSDKPKKEFSRWPKWLRQQQSLHCMETFSGTLDVHWFCFVFLMGGRDENTRSVHAVWSGEATVRLSEKETLPSIWGAPNVFV